MDSNYWARVVLALCILPFTLYAIYNFAEIYQVVSGWLTIEPVAQAEFKDFSFFGFFAMGTALVAVVIGLDMLKKKKPEA